jgi:hypothetical protein
MSERNIDMSFGCSKDFPSSQAKKIISLWCLCMYRQKYLAQGRPPGVFSQLLSPTWFVGPSWRASGPSGATCQHLVGARGKRAP